MKQKPKFVNYIGAMLAQGQYRNMCLNEEDVLTGNGSGTFTYIAPVFDSTQEQETWQSLHLDLEMTDCRLEVMAAASDEDFREFLEDSSVCFEQKEELLFSLNGIYRENTMDLLLTQLSGRYFYLLLKLHAPMEGSFSIYSARMEFPKNTFLEYFPEVYQRNSDFFERYISIFQTLYLDLERAVDSLVDRLDYEKAVGDDLTELAEWAGLDELWIKEALRDKKEDRLRRLIQNTNEIQSRKGTKKALKLLFDILYEKDVKILEYHQWYEEVRQTPELLKLYRRLYGDFDAITVFLDEKADEASEAEQKEHMQAVAQTLLPIGMKARIIPLDANSHLDSHCYLGKNSRLASPAGVQADNSRLYGNLILQ